MLQWKFAHTALVFGLTLTLTFTKTVVISLKLFQLKLPHREPLCLSGSPLLELRCTAAARRRAPTACPVPLSDDLDINPTEKMKGQQPLGWKSTFHSWKVFLSRLPPPASAAPPLHEPSGLPLCVWRCSWFWLWSEDPHWCLAWKRGPASLYLTLPAVWTLREKDKWIRCQTFPENFTLQL